MDKLKKSGMDMDMNIEQMDWVEDNKKVSPFIFTIILCDCILSLAQMSRNTGFISSFIICILTICFVSGKGLFHL